MEESLELTGKLAGKQLRRIEIDDEGGKVVIEVPDTYELEKRITDVAKQLSKCVGRVLVTADAARLKIFFYDMQGNQVSAATKIPSSERVDTLEATAKTLKERLDKIEEMSKAPGSSSDTEALRRYILETHGEDPLLMDDRAWEIKRSWDPATSRPLFNGDKTLTYFPKVDLSKTTSPEFKNCPKLVALDLDLPAANYFVGAIQGNTALKRVRMKLGASAFNFGWCFSGCTALESVVLDMREPTGNYLGYMFQDCRSLKELKGLKTNGGADFKCFFAGCSSIERIEPFDVTGATVLDGLFDGCQKLHTVTMIGLGTREFVTESPAFDHTLWGTAGDESRQSMVDTLLNYSFDRTSAGFKPYTLGISRASAALLTSEEKAAIAAKGFNLSVR